MILKREMESTKKSATVLAASSEGQAHQHDVHLYKELEVIKAEREQVLLLFSNVTLTFSI